uniref:Uncharacterized protein n=1 Tax=Romanomermis culicivorax TaxID=13658 RepID=A0A915LA98_ROMCU
MEFKFGKYMVKCVILDDDSSDQCIIGTNFLTNPNINAMLNFKEKFLEIQNIKMSFKMF